MVGEGYSPTQLGNKLKEYFGLDMITTNEPGNETVYTFMDTGNIIIRKNYEHSDLTKECIIYTDAIIIQDEIKAKAYDKSLYHDIYEIKTIILFHHVLDFS